MRLLKNYLPHCETPGALAQLDDSVNFSGVSIHDSIHTKAPLP
jgi:hypothetical protein